MTPDSSFIEDMDEYTWIWLYQSWLQDMEDTHKTYKDYALFLGAFYNPELAKNLSKQDNPDYESTEQDDEKTEQFLLEQRKNSFEKIRHRRNRKAKYNSKD